MSWREDASRDRAPSLAATATAATGAPSSSSTVSTRGLEQIPAAILTVADEIGRSDPKSRTKRVHRGRLRRREVAILRYPKDDSGNSELKILSMLASQGGGISPYLPEIFGACYERETTSLVQEFAIWGALKAALKNPELAPRISPTHKVHATMQLAQGMAFLQAYRVVHADLSCRNVLLFALEDVAADILVKITDFQLALVLQESVDFERRRQPQATRWCAPETVAHTKLSHRSDIWALGCTIWELFHDAASPWMRRDKRSEVANRLKDLAEHGGVAEGGTDVSRDFPQAADCPDTVHELILSCLQVDEYSRMQFAQISNRIARSLEEDRATAAGQQDDKDRPQSRSQSPELTSPVRVAQESSAPIESTAELPWEANGRSVMDDERDSNFAHFKALRAFLRSQLASETLPNEAVLAMWQEVDEAQAREAYLMDLVRRMQAVANESTEVVEMLEGSRPHSMTPPRAANGRWDTNGVYLTPSRSRFSQGMLLSGAPSYDHLVPLTPAGGSMVNSACPLPPNAGMWTLWSFIGSALRRQDFVLEADAWAAFDATNKSQPCMLRDPFGAEIAARAWVSSYFKLMPRGGVTTGSSVALRQASPQRPTSRSRIQHALPAWNG